MNVSKQDVQRAAKQSGFALLGAGDAAVAFAREAARRFPEQLRQTPGSLEATVGALARRGKGVLTRVRRDGDVQRAVAATKAATRRVASATRSVGGAAKAQVAAVDEAAEKVGKSA